ncbi:MAG: hypothetical protein JWO94_3987 [Verrucomicrobiaceae bacterium]|nr:hypothetical protein [Verrucomicrobiaceae bacterium]
MRFVTFIEKQPRWLLAAEALVLLVMVGMFDYATGRELSVSLLYVILVLGVAWQGGRNLALVFAFLSAVSWWWANKEVHPYGGSWGYAWATVSRLATFVFIAVGGSAVKAKQESDRQRIKALERAKDLEREIARISEHERRRIGQDLHDGICQVLAAIRCAASSVRDDLLARQQPEAATTGEVADMLGNAIIEVRNLARGIFPIQMESAGLASVLDELCETTRRLHRVQIVFETDAEVKSLPAEVAMHLYRIAQEALSNAVKHGGARHVAVTLGRDDGGLCLTVADDGPGFALSAAGDEDGMGLKSMRYRAQIIGAELCINSRADGVTITCRLPQPLLPS